MPQWYSYSKRSYTLSQMLVCLDVVIVGAGSSKSVVAYASIHIVIAQYLPSRYSDKILHAPVRYYIIHEVLQPKILQSSQRIRELEQALASAHSRFSADPHPLLIPSDVTSGSDSPPCVTASLATATRALGTLTIGDSGQTSYFGSTAGSEALFMVLRTA